MRRSDLGLQSLVLSALLACASAQAPAVAPRFTEPTLSGATAAFDPRSLHRPTLFAFWASWCPSCQREIEVLSELYAKERGKLDIIGVNVDRDLDKAKSFAAETQMPYASVIDTDLRVSDLFEVKKTPTFILVTKSGRISYTSDALDEDLFAALEEALK
jgi:thiol-disulfide isomerase/thioredoxin